MLWLLYPWEDPAHFMPEAGWVLGLVWANTLYWLPPQKSRSHLKILCVRKVTPKASLTLEHLCTAVQILNDWATCCLGCVSSCLLVLQQKQLIRNFVSTEKICCGNVH